MSESKNEIIWRQIGASIDMLENSIMVCPEDVWNDGAKNFQSFWYMVFHTLFWLDFYLCPSEDFHPPEPFTLDEFDPAGVLPERVYSKNEMLEYLFYCREKCRSTLKNLNDEKAGRLYRVGWGEASLSELLLDNMRHVQHHTAQLNLILRQKTGSAPGWISRTKLEL